jgi:hypothetical protein
MSGGGQGRWKTWAATAVALVVLALFLRWLFRTDSQVLSDAVDSAREALVEKNDEAFLSFFAPDVTYQGGGDLVKLKRDLARWHAAGISEVHVLSRTIEVDGEQAEIDLVVAAGPEFLRIDVVNVELNAEKDAEGTWGVRTFTWSRD